ncbi:hypothetical protein HanRHA438_Chr06g0271841 [Helianthus annuus]|nr:hypothetical protein HanRHA438_Chr06g0271841 [Helianthus annuus]
MFSLMFLFCFLFYNNSPFRNDAIFHLNGECQFQVSVMINDSKYTLRSL